MARAIDSEVAFRFLTEQLVKETGAFSKGVNKGLNIARSAMRNPDAIPTLTPPTEWVSVEDRLPDTDGAYLVYAPTYTGGSSSSLDCIGGIMFSRFKHEKWSIESGYYKRPNCVTHWMPIPTPYDIDHIHISEPPDGKKGWDKDGKSRRGTKL